MEMCRQKGDSMVNHGRIRDIQSLNNSPQVVTGLQKKNMEVIRFFFPAALTFINQLVEQIQ